MTANNHYHRLHKEYLLGLDERARQVELDKFETVQLHMYDWLQKEHGFTSQQAQDEVDPEHRNFVIDELRKEDEYEQDEQDRRSKF
ncbi:hypothetical protein [Domibacillus epiphyticus]|uniref:Uncharacterized protein n=1 Tax=Domibacillus epiphyticus TaxID=1714355 RepID=A0A1V2A610_9BACI|nr:hypothetical protein [Domibacillus epiphyticus]OMP66302.1 hypothetical protein BTO28_12600 [Domibacillus epiphyticus]